MSETNPTAEELVRTATFSVERAAVIPFPIDPTLSIEGEAADAKAVGDAIANIAAVKKVNSQTPNANGDVSLLASHIPMTSETGAQTVAEAIAAAQGATADTIKRTAQNEQTVESALAGIEGALTDGIGNEEVDAMFEEEEEGEET